MKTRADLARFEELQKSESFLSAWKQHADEPTSSSERWVFGWGWLACERVNPNQNLQERERVIMLQAEAHAARTAAGDMRSELDKIAILLDGSFSSLNEGMTLSGKVLYVLTRLAEATAAVEKATKERDDARHDRHACHYEWVNCDRCVISKFGAGREPEYGNICWYCDGRGKLSLCAQCHHESRKLFR